MSDWQIEYEQCPWPKGGWVYKFDHEPHTDGQWHPLNSKGAALYRILRGYLQFACPVDKVAHKSVAEFLSYLDRSGLLRTDSELEIVIRRTGESFAMWSHWCPTEEGVAFAEFSPESWNDAYQRLLDVEGAVGHDRMPANGAP